MTRLLIVSQVYRPSEDAVSQLLSDLCRYLVSTGLEVHVLTASVNYMTGALSPLRETIDGVTIWRTPSLPLSKSDRLGRLAAYGSFFALSWPALAAIPRPDVVLYESTPPFVGLSAPFARLRHGAKTCMVMQDVYPEVPVEMGVLQNARMVSALRALDRTMLSGVDHFIVLGERMREVMLDKGVPASKLSIIPNWPLGEPVQPMRRQDNAVLAETGLRDRFVVQYSGNMGVVHDMGAVAEAARILKDEPDFAFLMIGDGTRRPEMEAARDSGLDSIVMLPYQPRERLPVSLTAADVALVSLRPHMEGLVVPSKFYGILPAGVPVIFIGDPDGEVSRVIARHRCGMSVQNGQELADALRKLRGDPALRQDMADNARTAFEQHFSSEASFTKYAELITRLAAPA